MFAELDLRHYSTSDQQNVFELDGSGVCGEQVPTSTLETTLTYLSFRHTQDQDISSDAMGRPRQEVVERIKRILSQNPDTLAKLADL